MPGRRRLELAHTFAGAAARYWLGVFPQVGRELHHWHARAQRIPDPVLRRHALVTQRDERGNLEGAAAFAVLVPRAHRAEVIRATVAFQATYDYVDTLAEQPCANPSANGRQLHLALLSALTPNMAHPDYYEFSLGDNDAGYIRHLIETCRAAFGALPSYARVADGAIRAAERMVAYQSYNHGGEEPEALARWAAAVTPPGTGLMWWETAAGAASSLAVFALIAAAGQPCLSAPETAALEGAYFPWIGALHVLLDSLVDSAADLESGHHSLVEHYASAEEAATRLGAIATRAMQGTELLPAGIHHAMILAAMTSFYLSAPLAWTPGASAASRQVLEAVGLLAAPTMVVLRARRVAGRVLGAVAPQRGLAELSWHS